MFLRYVLIFLSMWSGIETLKIFVLFPMPSISHQRAIMDVTERLVTKGHELFVISPNALPDLKGNSNYTHVDVSFAYEYYAEERDGVGINLQRRMSKWDIVSLFKGYEEVNNLIFHSPQVSDFIKFIKSNQIQFDVIIVEKFYVPFAYGFSQIFQGSAPIISVSSLNVDMLGERSLGSFSHMSYTPFIFSEYTDKMNFWEKLENWYSERYMTYVFINNMESFARRYFTKAFGLEFAGIVDGCWNNISLSLISSNSLYFYPRLLGPNVIELGPMHLKTPKKLPQNLQDWLDGAEEGVIYFSLGSNMKSKSLPNEVRANFLKFFRELLPGYRVLWKWELDGNIPGQSDNILAQKWLPQDSVLAHPKVKVFITQGGLQSFQEAVHYGVPTVGIPWFGDQQCNVAKMVDAGVGAHLPPEELSSHEKIRSVIEAVLFNESYSKNMKRLSAISHDFTGQSLEKAVFWVEHVGKFGGAHLRPSTADASLFEYLCWDILTVILVFIAISISVLVSIVKFLAAAIIPSRNYKIKKS